MDEVFNTRILPILEDVILVFYLLTFLAGLFLFVYLFYQICRNIAGNRKNTKEPPAVRLEDIEHIIEHKMSNMMQMILYNRITPETTYKVANPPDFGRKSSDRDENTIPKKSDCHDKGTDRSEYSTGQEHSGVNEQQGLINDYYKALNELAPEVYMEKWNPCGLEIVNTIERSSDSTIEVIFREANDPDKVDYWKFELDGGDFFILPAPRVQQYILSYFNSTGSGIYTTGVYDLKSSYKFEITQLAKVKKNTYEYTVVKAGTMLVPVMKDNQ